MKKIFTLLVGIASFVVANAQVPFTTGNLVILRVGDSVISLTNKGNALFLDEYTTAGVRVQSVALPTTVSGANQPILLSGTATSEGALVRSANGLFLTLAGYSTTVGASTVSLATTTSVAVPRVFAIVKNDASINTSKTLTNYASATNPRGAYSNDGNSVWMVSGTKGVQYTTINSTDSAITVSNKTSTGTTVNNLRTVSEFDGQLFVTTGSGSAVRVGAVGNGLPTDTGKVITPVPGFPIANPASTYAIFAAKLPSTSPISNVVYVADDNTNGVGGIKKYALNILTSTYDSVGVIDAGKVYRGVTGVVTGNTVTIYAIRNADSLVVITDNAAYNAAPSSSTYVVLAAAPTKTAFRGIAWAPVPALATNNFQLVGAIKNNIADLQWNVENTSDIKGFVVEKSVNGKDFATLKEVAVSNTNNYSFVDNNFNNKTSYYRIKANKQNGVYSYTNIVALSLNNKVADLQIYPNPVQNFVVVNHPKANVNSTLRVYNSLGEQVLLAQVSEGTTQTYLTLSTLSKGNYSVVYQSNQTTITKQFVK